MLLGLLRKPSVRFILTNSLLSQSKTIMSTPCKLLKTQPTIGTHDQSFHCDDVTACYMLKQLPRFKDHDIVRTRDEELLGKCEIIVDVGGVLDVDKLRLDHHQRSFNQTIHDYHPKLRTTNPNKPPRLSSSGLVYAVFGKQVIMHKTGLGDQTYDKLSADDKQKVDAIYERAYTEFFEEIDAIDNGVEVAQGDNLVINYHINSGISSRVGKLNPRNMHASGEERLVLFKKAMDLVGAEISEGFEYLCNVWWPRQSVFRELVHTRKSFDPSGQIVKFDLDSFEGWKSAFLRIEEELDIVGELKFIIFPSPSEESPWRTLAMPVSLKSFESRVPLKEEWRGKRGQELADASGVPDASFVHMSGFTGGAKSLEGITQLVRKTLNLE